MLKHLPYSSQATFNLFTLTMNTEPESALAKAFPLERCQYLVKAVTEAFKEASELYREEIGHDKQFFGFAVYKTKKYLLAQYAANDEGVSNINNGQSFEMSVGEFTLSTFSGYGDGTIDDCFPRNQCRAPKLAQHNTRQLLLDLGFQKNNDTKNKDRYLNVYLMHRGDYDTGLEDVFLGIPETIGADGRVATWYETMSLWSSSSETSIVELSNISDIVPEEIATAEVELISVDEAEKIEKIK